MRVRRGLLGELWLVAMTRERQSATKLRGSAIVQEYRCMQSIPARRTELGSLSILRALPRRERRMVGPWCFLDRYGPVSFIGEKAMDVAPHPHMGLQTVSWLVSGEIIHKDSLGCEALMRAGQLNLMTAGRGISHSEETPKDNSGKLHGVQLWVALPDDQRQIDPLFDHYASLPVFEVDSATITLFIGEISQHRSPARGFSPIVGAEIALHEGHGIDFPLNRRFEHAVMVLQGDCILDYERVDPAALHYMAPGRDELRIGGSRGLRLLLIGGRPFGEEIVMWWNFVGRSYAEMVTARQEWEQHARFGEVKNYAGARLPAPAL
jgi:quercetin 2,3-dioxygenase